jgi:predicted nucleic acid-binding Zn ribbon protein
MPIYVYETIEPNDQPGEVIEVLQPVSAEPLTHHPDSGKPLKRVVAGFAVAGRWSDMRMQQNLRDKNLDQKGFTKYVKAGDGRYEKRAGQGPNVISADGSPQS